jgi:hypothetical protein
MGKGQWQWPGFNARTAFDKNDFNKDKETNNYDKDSHTTENG